MAKPNRGGQRARGGAKSSVSKRETPISEEDKAIVDGRKRPPEGGYFQTGESFSINDALRNDEYGDLSDSRKSIVEAMDRNMQPLDADIQVTRAVGNDYLRAVGINDVNSLTEMERKLKGGIITEKGFMSTSYDFEQNVFKHRPVRLQINAKKGTKALFSPTGKEGEMVLARGTKYKITGIDVVGGQYVFFAETI